MQHNSYVNPETYCKEGNMRPSKKVYKHYYYVLSADKVSIYNVHLYLHHVNTVNVCAYTVII